MNNDAIDKAADIIWQAWQQGNSIDTLPVDCRPQSVQEGYAIQQALVSHSKQAVFGWKIAATSVAGQTHIGVDGPIAGRLLVNKVSEKPFTVPLGKGNIMQVAEAEFAFRMGQDLPPREQPYTQEEVMDSVAALYPAVEIPSSRFADFATAGGPQLTADNACAYWFVLGAEADRDWRSIDLAKHPIKILINGATATEGQGVDALGDPRIALTWIANNHAQQGEGLNAGQIITTGVCGKPSTIQTGDKLQADFGELGQVSFTIN